MLFKRTPKENVNNYKNITRLSAKVRIIVGVNQFAVFRLSND